jgi:hypothetical protein
MNLLPREIEERYGSARGLIIPALLSPIQMEILQADEPNATKVWQVMVLVYAGARLVCQTPTNLNYLRPLMFSLPSDILDLEDFETEIKDAALINHGIELEIGHYLIMAQITFMPNNIEVGEDGGTQSRTIHLFTGRVRNTDEFLSETATALDNHIKLVKPSELNATMQAEWNEVKARRNTLPPHTKPDLKSEYNEIWVFAYARLVAQAFHQLFGWNLPTI